MSVIAKLKQLRGQPGQSLTVGLADDVIERFAPIDPSLEKAVDAAVAAFEHVVQEHPELLEVDETEQLKRVQGGLINFYAADAVNPYVSLAAKGPWIVTLRGAVIHDSGGYGMLGFGHAPDAILDAMNRPHVMANVMTPNVAQTDFVGAMKREVGHRRDDAPFQDFLCLNSGSESVSVAARLADINAKQMTDPGGRHAGKPIKRMAVAGGFHGRTDRPAHWSDSSRSTYREHCASFRDEDELITVRPNCTSDLEAAFERAEAEGFFIEALFVEPVMGEGDPGRAMTPKFYQRAVELTRAHGSLLLVDSIQAGLRAHGCLSIIDYPGFEVLPAPDMETYSKALNAGQYPLSVLAMNERAAGLYRRGIYGNTMTTNPRAMDVACAVMELVTPQLRRNITDRGAEFVEKLNALKDELGGLITKVQGTGLLFSCEVAPEYKAYGTGSLEEYLRHCGIGVIHGGENSLRYTPHFNITSAEVDLIVAATRDALLHGPRREAPLAKAG
ncbi:MAG: aminotransferase class III-fold pyridoxal phosphate-dependent enzyme [Pseudomonadota bacterium]